jgi:hypothetical protein
LRRLRAGYVGKLNIGPAYGEELAKLIEPTAPEVAKQMRSLTPEQLKAYIDLLVAILTLMGLAFNLVDDPPPQTQQIVINNNYAPDTTNIETTTIIIEPPPPVEPPAGDTNR